MQQLIICRLAILLLIILLAQPASAAEPGSEPGLTSLINQHVAPLLDAERAVGGVVGVLRDGETTFVGFGEVELGEGRRPDEHTIYEIGSITKVFTSVLLADMSLRGEVGLDDPAQKHLPDGVAMPQKGDRPITLKHLATHASGLPRLPSNLALSPVNPYADYNRDQLYEFLSGHTPSRAPGKSEYSNVGMGLLGHLLERRAGKSYERLVLERIAEPLGMDDTRITLSAQQRVRFAPPYRGDLEPDHRWDFDVLAGAGALRSTAADLLKLAAATTPESDQPIHHALRLSFDKQADVGDGYGSGLGWGIARDGDTRFHDGQTGGYHGDLHVAPSANTAVVLLSNTATLALSQVSERLMQAVLGADVDPAPFAREAALGDATLQSCVGNYVMAPFSFIAITLENGRLRAQLTGQDSYPIFATSETEFEYRVVDARITFERDESGAATQLTLHQNGADIPATRLKD